MKYHGKLLTHGWLFHHAHTIPTLIAMCNAHISMNVTLMNEINYEKQKVQTTCSP